MRGEPPPFPPKYIGTLVTSHGGYVLHGVIPPPDKPNLLPAQDDLQRRRLDRLLAAMVGIYRLEYLEMRKYDAALARQREAVEEISRVEKRSRR